VKLVAEAGIGTVASGVAKANADVIQVYRPFFQVHFQVIVVVVARSKSPLCLN